MIVDLEEFARSALREFEHPLADRGFELLSHKVERDSFRADYRAGLRYVSVRAYADPREAPPYFNVVLGEGSLEWPEADWNAVALWRMRNVLEGDEEGAEYELGSGPLLPLLTQAVNDLERYGGEFLEGDTTRFRRARASQNRSREPYKIHAPDGKGGYRTRVDPESAELKERFSRE
jgi:hypothetical protein